MDFISNLIKRPISLVRSDTVPSTPTDQGQAATSRPTTPHRTNSPLLPFERATTPESRQQHIANALNGCLVASNIMDTLNIRDEFRPIAVAAAAATRASPPISRQSPTQALSRSLQTSLTSSNSSGSGSGSNLPATTSGNTIEELLIQINDNLNLGDLHAGAELSQHHLPNRPLSVSPSALTQALSSEFNAICSKSANLKVASSSQSKESLPSSSPPLKTAAMAPVADNATAANILVGEKSNSDIEPKSGIFGGDTAAAHKTTDSHLDKPNKPSDNQTISLNESKLSEMPTTLNINTEECAKLTFEDGLIPTLTAAINEHGKGEPAAGKDESNSEKSQQHLQVNTEPDTAASSDNEIFAECQSYQLMSANNDYGYIADEYSFDNSEIESYFSAANSRNATITNVGADPLSLTMNKIPEQSESDQGDLQSMLSALSGDELLTQQNNNPLNFTFEDEPMDVDISFTEIKEQINVGEIILPKSNINDENVTPFTIDSLESVVKTMPCVKETDGGEQVSSAETSTNSATNIEILGKDPPPPLPEVEFDVTQFKLDLPLNKSFEIPTSTTQTTNNEQSILDSRITATATEVNADLAQTAATKTSSTPIIHSGNNSANSIDECEMKKSSIEEKQNINKSLTSSHGSLNVNTSANSVDECEMKKSSIEEKQNINKSLTSSHGSLNVNTSANSVDECEMKKSTTEAKQEMNKSLTGSHGALNLTIDMTSSTNSSKSSASSPSFPLKHKGTCKEFPRSPTAADVSKSTPFLEKSEYTERIEIERKRSTASEPKQALLCTRSRKTSAVDEKPARAAKSEKDIASNIRPNLHLTETIADDISSTGNDGSDELNGTFDGVAVTAADAGSKDVNLTDSFSKRRTFNLPPVAPAATEETTNVAQNCENEKDKRRTFNMPNTMEKEIKMTENFDDQEKRRTFNISAVIPVNTTTSNHEEMHTAKVIEDILPAIDAVKVNSSIEPTQIPTQSPQSPTTTVPNSPPIPTLQNRIKNALPSTASPPLPTLKKRSQEEEAEETFITPVQATEKAAPPAYQFNMDDDAFKVPLPPSPASSTASLTSPPMPIIQKRPSIHAYKKPEDIGIEVLSAKEQTKRDARDEKDVFAGNCTPSPMEEQPSSTSNFSDFGNGFDMDIDQQEFANEEFQSSNNCNNNAPIDRSSILLKFDPLLGVPVPANQIQQKPAKETPQILQQFLANNIVSNLSPTIEEDEHSPSASLSSIGNNQSLIVETDNKRKSFGQNATSEQSGKSKQNTTKVSIDKQQTKEQKQQEHQQQHQVASSKKHASMSVEVIKDMNIDNDCNKSFEKSNSQPDEKQINYKMDELEKKIKNEVLKTEDIEKKLKEAEQREEALIKRITEKDKTITKMTGVIEAYEKAIAELIAEKEQLIQNYEKQLAEAKADRDSNYQHLTSLETTFADLHVKYGKSKEMTLQLKSNEEALVAEKRQILENLRLQEQRYDKMKNHAMQQLEIANKKLDSLNKEHSIEATKLKALLKKEEISRASVNEQLQQKSRENAELVKICDELINGQGS